LANEENTLSISNILSLCKGLTMPSFDIVSELELFEVNHAVQNTEKEIATRFDFRGQDVSIELNEKNKEIKISTESDFQCEQVYTMLENHFYKRKIDVQALDPQKATASGALSYRRFRFAYRCVSVLPSPIRIAMPVPLLPSTGWN
jgi:uncharacterized protein YajQ (UPF0234 family)